MEIYPQKLLEMINMNQDFDCGDCIHFDGDVCVNCVSANYGGDIICAEDCAEFERF